MSDSARRAVSLQRQLLVVLLVQKSVVDGCHNVLVSHTSLEVDDTGTHSSFQRQSGGHSSCATDNTTVR